MDQSVTAGAMAYSTSVYAHGCRQLFNMPAMVKKNQKTATTNTTYEPGHSIPYKMSCAPSDDSDKPAKWEKYLYTMVEL